MEGGGFLVPGWDYPYDYLEELERRCDERDAQAEEMAERRRQEDW